MSDNLGHPMPDGALNVPPSDVSTQGGQHVQVLVLEAASDLQSADTNPEGDPQALDPEITRTNDLEVADSVRANPQVPASVLQGSVAVGLQISAAVSISLLPPLSILSQGMVANDTAHM